ncbi:MAG TPA: tRNA (N6-isopentenyl adenosine(37)-C2)-methylthiotransferase MiaB [Planctomycetota bacterium]|nr:tRNA (N6-isopentenyl adenosine(37)-C2)-methylthiotransferase MiaB [Planctomycetota bacterium]
MRNPTVFAEETTAQAVPKVHFVTFGCQMNALDSELALGRFLESGFGRAESVEEASVVVLNTCSVREHAEERVFSRLGELRREKERRPDLIVAVTGCLPQRVGEGVFRRSPVVDVVVGTREFPRLPELVREVLEGRGRTSALSEESQVEFPRNVSAHPGGPHAFVAVMRGCDLHCTFCIVPTVRGRVQSRGPGAIVEEVRRLVERGVREVTLLGQTVNSYGYDLGRGAGAPRLSGLLRALSEVEGLARIRLVTNHAAYLTDDLIEAVAELPKVVKFLPVPMQSGSDRILRSMRRGYTVGLYRRRIERLREAVPGVEMSSDWIVGFPGETEEDFAKSERALEEIGFLQNFVFKFSPRPGTDAARARDDVPEAVKRERNNRLLAIAARVAADRHRARVGEVEEVLVEGPSAKRPGRLAGRTDRNHLALFEGPAALAGTTVRVRVLASTTGCLLGALA